MNYLLSHFDDDNSPRHFGPFATVEAATTWAALHSDQPLTAVPLLGHEYARLQNDTYYGWWEVTELEAPGDGY